MLLLMNKSRNVQIYHDNFWSINQEVEVLLHVNSYHDFVTIANTMNVSDDESLIKLKKSLAALTFATAILAVIIWAEYTGRLTTRWVRSIILTILFMGFTAFEAYMYRLCILCAQLNTTTVNSQLKSTDCKNRSAVKKAYDLFAKEALMRRARFITFRIVPYLPVTIGIALALPPYTAR